ncbi:PAAR domain-containing protein [Aeromonas veronii]|uniref:PAAR domain-containing protein n=1 Tax=Aeromonas veronii TaxID=654 RepID=UPI0030071085
MQNVIQKGAPTTTGGVVLEGNDGILVEGKIFTSIGQMASCPQCKQGQGPIVPNGPRTIDLPAGPAALHDDFVACGCPPGSNKVIAMQGSTFGGAQGGGASARAASASPASPATSTSASSSTAPTIDAANAYWPPYDFAQGKELEVVYTQNVIDVAIMSLHEANEFYTNLWVEKNGKDTLGYGKTGYDMVKSTFEGVALAKGLGGLGVQAYTKNIKGVDYVIIKGYKKHLKTLVAGNIWKASNPNVIRLGLGTHGTRSVIKMGVVVDVTFAIASNAVDTIVRDDADFRDFIGNASSDIIKALIVTGIMLIAAPRIASAVPAIATGATFVAVSFGLGEVLNVIDQEMRFTEKFNAWVKENIKHEP